MTVTRDDIHEIEMELTGHCNLSCYICTRNFVHSQHLIKTNVRPIEEITKQLDTFKNLRTFFIAGTISEPTLYPQFFNFLEYLNFRKIKYEIYSNACTHNYEWWKKLGEIVPDYCKVVFTVCGSTQELHEFYRVGSNLEKILKHAEAFRLSGNKNDYCQHILFEYNENDFNSGNMNPIFNQFSHTFQVHSEGRRLKNEKIRECPCGVNPPKKIETKINYIFDKIPPLGSDIGISCKLKEWKKMYIDQFGNLFPCYTYAECGYPPFDKNSNTFSIDDILKYKYPECFLCSSKTNKLIKDFKLDFVC